MDLVFFGIQGSGKGTQAKKLAAEFGYDIFEAGGELRKIAASGSELGHLVKSTIDQGHLVPHEIIMQVVKEAIAVITKRGIAPDRITLVGNTPPLSILEHAKMGGADCFKSVGERFTMVYVGGIQWVRGIQTVLDAIPEIIKNIPHFLFLIVGDGYAAEHLKERVIKEKLQDYVLWTGWIEHEKIYDYIVASQIGVIPHLVTDHTNTTVPNKLFDLMALGLPIIASDAVPIKRILNEENCGISFRGGDAIDLAQAVIKLYHSNFDYAKNGIQAVKREYHWEADKKRLLEAIHLVIEKQRNRTQ